MILTFQITHRTLFQILVDLMVLNTVFFNRVVDEWNVYTIILENQTVMQLLKEMF